jgi:outer membrane immunogenic protein
MQPKPLGWNSPIAPESDASAGNRRYPAQSPDLPRHMRACPEHGRSMAREPPLPLPHCSTSLASAAREPGSKNKETTMKTIAALFLASAAFAAPAFAGGPTAPEPETVVVPDAAPYVAPGYDWSGIYAGAQLGYGDIDSNGAGLDGHGFLGGIHAGYRWDLGNFVAGAELDFDVADIDVGATGDTLDDVARLKLIAGTEFGRSLVYGTVGAARASATVGGVDLSDNGWFIGAGMDYAVSDRWTVGGELMQHQFDDFDGSGVDLDATTLKAKVSLRF